MPKAAEAGHDFGYNPEPGMAGELQGSHDTEDEGRLDAPKSGPGGNQELSAERYLESAGRAEQQTVPRSWSRHVRLQQLHYGLSQEVLDIHTSSEVNNNQAEGQQVAMFEYSMVKRWSLLNFPSYIWMLKIGNMQERPLVSLPSTNHFTMTLREG